MCQINPTSPYNHAEESDAIREFRKKLTDNVGHFNHTPSSVIENPQSEAVKQLMARIRLGDL